ncbi:MAG: hypothetical protein IJ324_02165 [Lachnospiraceae bacterium]|nr:hypothetical protein [Lachnospiraceae bacterium]
MGEFILKKAGLNLHIDRKRTLLVIVFFSVISILLSVITSVSTNKDFIQLNSLMHSDYEYTAIMQKPIDQDNYYQFNAGVYFAVSPHAEKRLNVEILMQAIEVEYTDLVYWNAEELGTYDVAISQSIADDNGLEIGDKLYSKHIVDGTVYEYSVVEILPDVANVRVSEEKNYSAGIIIMGFDKQYVDNITHHSLVFTREPVDVLASQYSDMPESIRYRTDEILAISKELLPYLILFVVLSALNMAGLVFFITKEITTNYRRLIMLGFEKKMLNESYKRLVIGKGILALIITISTSVVVSSIVGFEPTRIVFLMIVMFMEFITLLWMSAILNRRLWRA